MKKVSSPPYRGEIIQSKQKPRDFIAQEPTLSPAPPPPCLVTPACLLNRRTMPLWELVKNRNLWCYLEAEIKVLKYSSWVDIPKSGKCAPSDWLWDCQCPSKDFGFYLPGIGFHWEDDNTALHLRKKDLYAYLVKYKSILTQCASKYLRDVTSSLKFTHNSEA